MNIAAMRAWPAAFVAVALFLAGCGGILPKPAAPPALYRLTAAADFPAGGTSAPTQLAIEAPTAEAALDTTRIALSRSPTTLDYFADAAWTDRLPLVLQARLVDSFDNAHRLVALAGEAGAAHRDAILTIELQHFEAEYGAPTSGASAPPRWRVELTADLVSETDRTVIATRTFTGEAPAPQNDMSAIVDTADQVWRGVAAEIVDWAADTLAQNRGAAPGR